MNDLPNVLDAPLAKDLPPGDEARGEATGDNGGDMPLPHDPQTIFLAGLFLLAVIASLYAARPLVLPIVLALVLKLLLQPLVRHMVRFHVPKAIAALLAVALLVAVFVGFGSILVPQAAVWAGELPQLWTKLDQQYGAHKDTIETVRGYMQQFGITGGGSDLISSVSPGAILGNVASGASGLASFMLEMLLVLLYLLVSGDTFLLRLVEVLPRLKEKKQAVGIADHVEEDMSMYLVTITLINAVVAVLVGLVAWLFSIPGAVLWGVVAFFLNYIPVLGPLSGVVLFLALGVFTQSGWLVAAPAACYLLIHTCEGEFFTPMLLARRFTLNPVAVMIGLLFWSWMWGITGAVLAVPLLAVTKIVCDRIRPLRAFGHLLEG